jgi:hypothetical protein
LSAELRDPIINLAGLIDRYYGGAGRSGMRRYKELARDWRQRTFGRRTSVYFWTLYPLALIGLLMWTPGKWRFGEGLFFGMPGMAYLMLPDALMPEHIAVWQRGAWRAGHSEGAQAAPPGGVADPT